MMSKCNSQFFVIFFRFCFVFFLFLFSIKIDHRSIKKKMMMMMMMMVCCFFLQRTFWIIMLTSMLYIFMTFVLYKGINQPVLNTMMIIITNLICRGTFRRPLILILWPLSFSNNSLIHSLTQSLTG